MTDEIRDEEMGTEEEGNTEQSHYQQYSNEEIMNSVSLNEEGNENEVEEDEHVSQVNEDHKVDPNEVKVEEEIDQDTLDLYNEFNSFIKDKTGVDESVGSKVVIPTGIDLIDAILGGGFAVGCLNIIVGQPGGGKCLDYNEEVEVWVDESTMLKKKKMKIGELFEKYVNNYKLDEICETSKDMYIKSDDGELVKLNGLIKKDETSIYRLYFESGNSLNCAGEHLLKINNEEFSYARDLEKGSYVKTIYGYDKVESKEYLKNDYVYDLSMKEKYVYQTPNGMIHHNSMLAAQTVGRGQREYNGKMLTGFLDAEESMTTKRLYNLGVRKPKLKPYSDITAEKVFKYLEGLCLFKREKKMIDTPSIVVWDSIANTLSEKEREADDINSVIGYKARMLSMLIPKYVSKCSEHNICLLAINQLREKIQMGPFQQAPDLKFMGASKDMPGGSTLKFNAFQLVSVNIKTAIDSTKPESKYPFDGFVSKIKCIKNKLFTPNVEIEAIADFYNGFSNFWTNYNFLANTKRIKTGAWNYIIDDPEVKKFRTKDAEKMYNEDEKFRETFDRVVKEAIQNDIVDKYDQ